ARRPAASGGPARLPPGRRRPRRRYACRAPPRGSSESRSARAPGRRRGGRSSRRRLQREPRVQPPAAVGPRPALELAAVERDALAHADQAVPAALALATALTGVGDVELEVALAVAQTHRRRCAAAVLERVGQPLLDHAIGGQVEPGWERHRLTLD